MKKILNTLLLIFLFSVSGISQTNSINEFNGEIYLNNQVVNNLLPNYYKEGIYVFYNPISISKSGDTTILCNDVFHYSCNHIKDTLKKQYLIKSITQYKNNKANGLDISFNQNSIDSSYYKNDICLSKTRTVFSENGIPISSGSLITIEILDTTSMEVNGQISPIIIKNEEQVKNGIWVYSNIQGKVIRKEEYSKGVLVK